MKSFNPVDLQLYIVRPVLKQYNLWSLAAENLLMGTAAQESHCGKWIKQMEGGPARGIYQMEPRTYLDIIQKVVPKYEHIIGMAVSDFCPNPDVLIYDVRIATLMCRLQYVRFKEKLPAHHDLPKLARHWKQYYNTVAGKGTVNDFLGNYNQILCRPYTGKEM